MNNTAVSFDIPTPPRKGTRVLRERLGVSRAPIYDAFTRLQAEALVDVVPQRGTTVSLIKISDARENMFLRRAIEVEAVRAITRNLSGEHLEALKQNLRYQSAAVASTSM